MPNACPAIIDALMVTQIVENGMSAAKARRQGPSRSNGMYNNNHLSFLLLSEVASYIYKL